MKQVLLCLALLLAGLGVGRGGTLVYDKLFNPPRETLIKGDYRAQLGDRPILFMTSTCPHCQRALAYFQSHKIAFDKQVIDESSEAKSRYVRFNQKAVPLVVTPDMLIVGYKPEAYEKYVR